MSASPPTTLEPTRDKGGSGEVNKYNKSTIFSIHCAEFSGQNERKRGTILSSISSILATGGQRKSLGGLPGVSFFYTPLPLFNPVPIINTVTIRSYPRPTPRAIPEMSDESKATQRETSVAITRVTRQPSKTIPADIWKLSRAVFSRSETSLTANGSISLQLATWAPRGNGLVYVYQNNIYYRPEAEVAVDYQITDTGVFGIIYNGVPDWVYEGNFSLENHRGFQGSRSVGKTPAMRQALSMTIFGQVGEGFWKTYTGWGRYKRRFGLLTLGKNDRVFLTCQVLKFWVLNLKCIIPRFGIATLDYENAALFDLLNGYFAVEYGPQILDCLDVRTSRKPV
ncbi:Inactive dipeptidyl peptidase 10 [Eufriesea mexicana]|nr:Inactive dipeptidyl peptidase 10 [Eufriesea mexicana]